MFRSIFPLGRALAYAFLLCSLWSLPASAQSASSVYEVTRGDQRLLLGGTIHLLRPEEFPLPAPFYAAYQEADVIYLEADPAIADDPHFGQQVAQVMLYPTGKTLSSELAPETWQALVAYAEANDFPLQQMIGFHPAMVSLVISVTEAQRRGMTDGVETHFAQMARKDGVPIGELEGMAEVMTMLEDMKALDEDEIILHTLRDLENLDDFMGPALDAWRVGDMDALYTVLGKPFYEESEEFYHLILTDRNKLWVERLQPIFEQDATALVLVGALHLAGDNSLIKMLEARGYQVRPYIAE
ncbi:TraB/GumN family protein [Marinimicrobium alkaliphilum]|uniref:TraB/GumN family protein n=1 Tax=Marinimicrobium alkaliphilum TaxID=2202654 RepID=UPI000DB9F1AC|nr:TraB/GumN family protein [Marinimicrobium alkaliphilum]